MEDKILQRAVVEVLNSIYEADFLGFSYGFRPGRKQHDALDALATGIKRKQVNWVLDADIRDYFTSLDWSWLVRFLEHRIADRRILRLIQKWLAAGVIEDGSHRLDCLGLDGGEVAAVVESLRDLMPKLLERHDGSFISGSRRRRLPAGMMNRRECDCARVRAIDSRRRPTALSQRR